MATPWPLEDLWLALSPMCPGLSLEWLPSIDSTNTELMRRARQGQIDPVMLIAETQTAGRGRLGRNWTSRAQDSLTFSLGLMLNPPDWSGLSLAVGVALAESLTQLLHAQPPHVAHPDPDRVVLGLKWPNDLWCDPGNGPHKLGGILIETATLPDPGAALAGRYAVIGVGLNLRTPEGVDSSIPPLGLQDLATGLQAPHLLRELLPGLMRVVLDFNQQGFAPLLPRFARRDWLRDQAIRLSDGREGWARGVDAQGQLLVDTDTGRALIHSNEISIRPRR
ncbi:MAG: biotin--[acetyl-CoA-carboxylase] ligase [Limnohabitans sp.]|jgi:BirA family biotin operon repressor/biotin-[acetyl-CoA-carboxylase] ligase|nr:biotin--[acetyl-CoA-carboxylase] ligase [Limnohabitans sp.]